MMYLLKDLRDTFYQFYDNKMVFSSKEKAERVCEEANAFRLELREALRKLYVEFSPSPTRAAEKARLIDESWFSRKHGFIIDEYSEGFEVEEILEDLS